jgi:hypothetical protein
MSDPPTFFGGEIVLDKSHGLIARRTCVACNGRASIYAQADLCETCCEKNEARHIYDGPRCRYCGAEKPEPGK